MEKEKLAEAMEKSYYENNDEWRCSLSDCGYKKEINKMEKEVNSRCKHCKKQYYNDSIICSRRFTFSDEVVTDEGLCNDCYCTELGKADRRDHLVYARKLAETNVKFCSDIITKVTSLKQLIEIDNKTYNNNNLSELLETIIDMVDESLEILE